MAQPTQITLDKNTRIVVKDQQGKIIEDFKFAAAEHSYSAMAGNYLILKKA